MIVLELLRVNGTFTLGGRRAQKPFRVRWARDEPPDEDLVSSSILWPSSKKEQSAMQDGTLSLTDSRTSKTYTIPIIHGNIRAIDLRQIKVHDDDFGMMSYDPAFTNTASCESYITFIDGDRGIVTYRGYTSMQSADNCSSPVGDHVTLVVTPPTISEPQKPNT